MQIQFAHFLLSVIFWARVVCSQTVVDVTVGDEGSFFTPQIVTAKKGDMVSFKWTGMFHSVTQSSFDNPCTPLKGGFDSGVTGNPPNATILPVWNLTITDDSTPIWFFCKVTVPESHCISGMVGAINAVPSGTNNSFDVFLQNAKSITDPPAIPMGLPPALTGVGAESQSTPVPLINQTNITSTSSSSFSSSTTTLSSSSTLSSTIPTVSLQTARSSSSLTTAAKAGLAGGIAGAVVLTVIIVAALLSFRRAIKYKKEARRANKMLRDKEAESDFVHIGHSVAHHPTGSITMSDATEPDGSAAGINIKELAAEIAKNIRQEAELKGPGGGRAPTNYPESAIAQSLSRGFAESNKSGTLSGRGTESTRTQPRQLPVPPNQMQNPLNSHNSFDQSLPPYGRH